MFAKKVRDTPRTTLEPVKQYHKNLNKGVVGGSRYWVRGRYQHDAVSSSLRLPLNGFNFSLVWQAPGEHTEIHNLNSHAELVGYLFVCACVCGSGDNLRTCWKSCCCYVHRLLVAYRCPEYDASNAVPLFWEAKMTNTVFIRLFKKNISTPL